MSMILGLDGQPLDTRRLMRSLGEPQTASIGPMRREFDRHPARGLTPARLAQVLKDAEAGDLVAQLELADDMEERDAHLYAELSKRRGAVTSLAWSIEPPDNPSAQEETLTEQVRDWVGMLCAHANGVDGGMEVLLGAMTSAVLQGFAPIELVWKLQRDDTGRQVLIPHGTLQPHRWFTLSADRRRFLLRSSEKMVPGDEFLPPTMGIELEPFSWLMHVHPARNGYLARMSLARVLVWPYLFKNYAVRDLAEFLEIYGLPLRLGKYPAGASDEEKRTLLQAVAQIGHNAAGIIPQSMALEFESAAAGTEVPFAAMWDRLDAAESKAILGQTLTASEGQHGTQALGKVHNEVRMDIRDADARLVEGSFTRQIIYPLCVLNVPGINPRRLPRLALDTGEPDDLATYADNLPKLAKAGLKIPVRWVRDKLRIPEPEDGEAVLEVSEPPPLPGQVPGQVPGQRPGQPPGRRAPALSAAERQALTGAIVTALAAHVPPAPAPAPPRDLIDELVDEQAAQWQPLLGPLMTPLLAELDKSVAAGESVLQFAARVPELVRLLDAQPLTERLARAAFAARLAGEADLDLEG